MARSRLLCTVRNAETLDNQDNLSFSHLARAPLRAATPLIIYPANAGALIRPNASSQMTNCDGRQHAHGGSGERDIATKEPMARNSRHISPRPPQSATHDVVGLCIL